MILSVIVAVYNIAEWVFECISSISRTQCQDFECILVDDCSTDFSGSICDEVAGKDTRFKVIHKAKNEGLPQARKTGFEAASGEYIWFVDGDDWIEENIIEIIIFRLENKRPDCLRLGCYVYGFYWGPGAGVSGESLVEGCLKGELLLSFCINVIKKEIVGMLIFPVVSSREDVFLTVQVFYLCNTFDFLRKGAYHYRWREGSLEGMKNVHLLGKDNVLWAVRYLRSRFPDISRDLYLGFLEQHLISRNLSFPVGDDASVTVVVPVYNGEEFLENCLRSIRLQRFYDFKCVLVDDCSTDGSGVICDRVAREDKRFSVIHFERHQGVCVAREAGVMLWESEWICFIDADDMVHPYFLYDMLLASKGCDMVVCGVGGVPWYRVDNFVFKGVTWSDYLLDIFSGRLEWPVWGRIIRRGFVFCLVRPKSQFSEDRVVLVQVLMGRPRIGLVRSVLYLYNPYNEESVSRKVSLADVRKEGEKENRKLARKLVLQGVVRLDLVINYGCNMNCYGCNHLAPLYDEDEVVPLDTIKDQVKKLAMLEGESFVIWAITGGEPLLHPNIGDVLRVVRFYFSGEILLWTNGLLLNKMSIDFWSALEECDVTLVVSVYGEGVDRSVFSEHKSIRVFFINKERFHVVGLSGVCEKGMKSTCNCNCNCLTVMKGKIYKCPVAGNLERFNKYFGENIPVSEKDFIDLNAIVNWKQLQVFHGKPSPLCSVCDRGVGVSWGLSKKEKSEWMVEESKE